MEISQSIYNFMLDYSAEKDVPILSYKGKSMHLDVFKKEVERVAAALQELGVKKGDSVAVVLLNTPEAIVTVYAINRAGAVANVIHPKTHPEKLKEILEKTNSRVVFASSLFLHEQFKAFSGRQTIVCGGFSRILAFLNGARSFKNLKSKGIFKPVLISGEDIAAYMHSGGTSGEPKTVTLSNRALNALVFNLLTTIGKPYSSKDAMLMVLPLFHGFGFAVSMHAAMSARIRVVPVPIFRSKKMVKIIGRERITVVVAIPRMLQKMLAEENFAGAALASVEDVYCGGDVLTEDLKNAFEKRLWEGGSKGRVCRGYGLTEMGSVCVLNLNNKEGSVGKPLINTRIKVLDEDGNDAETGVLYMRGTALMSGYSDGNGFVEIDGEKWLNTGDIVSADKDGNLFFKSRAKRLIKISGINVFPSEIEEYASSISFVEDAAAVEKTVNGKPRIVLFVRLSEKVENAEAKIHLLCKQHLSRWYIPTEVYVVDKFPVTRIGKTDTNELERIAAKMGCNN